MVYFTAGICVATAAFMPVMKFIPSNANISGILLTAFGHALLTIDGLLVVMAISVIGITGGLIAFNYQ